MTGENGDETRASLASSFVSDVIDFKALENPSWRSLLAVESCPTVEKMLNDILKFRCCFESQKEKVSKDYLEVVKNDFLVEFIFRLNREEDHGLGTREETKESLDKVDITVLNNGRNKKISVQEQETLNVYLAYRYLEKTVDQECNEDPSLYGFIESGIVKKLHKIILNNLPLSKGMTKPGVCSNNERYTTFQGEIHHYPNPDDMDVALNTTLDRFNSLLNWLNNEKDDIIKIYKLFKASGWLLFELLDLHPFGDGNGRLFRLMCSYVLSLLTPFPTPVHNIWCDSSTDNYDYYNALINARKSTSRHPEELTTMIIECNWNSWKEFLKKLQLY